MRIVAGSLKGRLFDAPSGFTTHPMSEKARSAIFNALGDLSSLTVLDAFAGSGALAFEAVSRGASQALVIEKDFAAFKLLNNNIIKLSLQESIKAIRANCSSWSKNNAGRLFDIVICDPPYNNWQPKAVQVMSGHVRPGGLLIISSSAKNILPEFSGFRVLDTKKYSDASIGFFRKID